jgi:transcriptional regulator with XRE-family HTH domain
MALGERIRQRREYLRMSQQDLAQLSHMPQTIVSRIERGVNKNPGADVLKRLAIALRCSVDWLLEMYDDAPDDISALLPACASP